MCGSFNVCVCVCLYGFFKLCVCMCGFSIVCMCVWVVL